MPMAKDATNEDLSTASVPALHIKQRITSSSNAPPRRVYDSDRFKLVQRRRASNSPSHALSSTFKPISDRDENVEMARVIDPVFARAVETENQNQNQENVKTTKKKKKEATPQPVVPNQILETCVSARGDVATRTYVKGKFLGKGGFARCYELTCKQTGKSYAAKVVAKSSLLKLKTKQKFTSEIKIHKSLHHPQIVQFEHFFEDEDNAYILLELCRNQSMSDLMRRRKRLSESEVRFYMRQLVEGLAYLHEALVIHRDLKLGNLFLMSDMRLKIGDFGLAARLDDPEDRKRTMCGTPNYIAPEILNGQRGDGHSFEVDIWSTGVVMYTMLVGRPPFETNDVKTTYKLIRANQYDFPETAHVSRLAQSLVRRILRNDPGARLSLDQILKHPFLADEFVPASLPRTALLVTPPTCKRQSFATRHSDSEDFAGSAGGVVPTPSAASKQYPLQTRDVNALIQRASDPGALPNLLQLLPRAHKRGGSRKTAGLLGSTTTQLAPSGNTTVISSSHNRTTNAPVCFQDVLESACKTLSRFFYLQEYTHSSEGGDTRLSESSPAATIVAAAQRLKEIRAEAEAVCPLVPATLWISQWVDYTSKYGIGYMLSNGGSGVYFNDSTKMISSADGRIFEYIERQSSHNPGSESQVRYTMDNYDHALNKKVSLLGHFKGYLVDARAENDEADTLESQLARSFVLSSRGVGTDIGTLENCSGDGSTQPMVFVMKWVKTRHAVLFQLSNRTIQLNFFDKSKLMLSANACVATYLNRDGDLAVFPSATAILTSERPDLGKRLRYAKDMLQQMLDQGRLSPIAYHPCA
uniref:Serine/threonine-protein kinase PLK n=1 Tax=Hyaloperonospora arabidopsidis (strain Emoy2) TaxID=559515 RepID=M4BT72_HYAAE